MSHRQEVVSRALVFLDRGDRAEAEAMLRTARDEGVDGEPGWGVVLLSELLGQGLSDGVRTLAPGEGVVEVLRNLVLGSHAIREGRAADAARCASTAGEILDADPGEAAYLRLRVASLFQAAFRFTGLPAHHQRGLAYARPVADRLEAPVMAVLARSILSTMHHVAGALHQSVDVAESAIGLAGARGLERHRFVALAHQFRGYALFEWNRLAEARAELEVAWDLSSEQDRGVRSGVARVLAGLTQVQGDTVAADTWLGRLESVVSEPMTLRNREWLAAVRIRHGSASRRDLRVIDSWRQRYQYDLEGLLEIPPEDRRGRLGEIEHLISVLESASQWDAVLRIAPLLAEASAPARVWFTVRARAAQAVAEDAVGKADKADESLREALRSGQTGSFVRAFIDGSPRRLGLLRRAMDDAEVGAWASRVLAAAGDVGVGSPARLTSRQSEVLAAVARGFSNPRIAADLGVSESTVRTHLRAIFQRLEVASRTAAVAEARRVGLVE